MTLRLGFLASGGGTNLQSILDACASGVIEAEPAVVVGNNSKARALERARLAGIDTVHLSSATHPDAADLDLAILDALLAHGVDLVVLAGYNKKVGPAILEKYRNRVVNVHPSLLPRHGGVGLYGARVHESVLSSRDAESGASIHIVDGEYDQGPVIAQIRIPVNPGDTADLLAARVLEQEHILYVDTLRRISTGDLTLPAP